MFHTHVARIFLEGFMRLHFFVAWSDWKSFKDFRDIIVQPQKRFEGTEFMSDFYHHWSTYLTGLLFRVVLNQRANRIHACGLWQEVQFDMGLKVQDIKYHHKVRLQSSFESKSEQDSCVWPVTRDSIWHLDLIMQDMNYHHKVRLQSSFQSKSKQHEDLLPSSRHHYWYYQNIPRRSLFCLVSLSFYCLLQ